MIKVAVIGEGTIARIITICLLLKTDAHITIFGLSGGFTGNTSCGIAAAGMVAPTSELYLNEERLYINGMKSLSLWPELLRYFGQSECDNIFSRKDTIILAHKHNKGEMELVHRRIKNHTESEFVCDFQNYGIEINQSLLSEGILVKKEGVVNVPLFFKATKFLDNERVLYVQKNINNPLEFKEDFKYVFDTRGMAAKEQIKSLFGVRGEALEVYAPNVEIHATIRFLHSRHQLYIVPRGDYKYYIGATSIQAEDESNISVQSMIDLLGMLCFVNPAFSEARLVNTFTGCRPSLPSGLPEVTLNDNIIVLNGFSRHGYLLGPSVCIDAIDALKF